MDFKPIYDAVNAANAEAQAKAAEINDLIAAGEVEQALAMETGLDEATAKADSLKTLYDKMVAAGSRDVLAQFVPAAAGAQEDKKPKTITRAEFDALPENERRAHLRDGGKIVDKGE